MLEGPTRLGANVHFVTSVRIFLSFLSALFRVWHGKFARNFFLFTWCHSGACAGAAACGSASPGADHLCVHAQLSRGGARVLHAQGNVRRDQQMETLADIIQTALMLRINKRRVGRAVLMEYSKAVKCAYE